MAVFSGNGSVSAPSFTFSSDTNTGIYRVGTDDLGIACGGAAIARFYGTGPVLLGQEASSVFSSGGGLPGLQLAAQTSSNGAHINVSRFAADTNGPIVSLVKSRSASVGSFTGAVVSGDDLGIVRFSGDDGSTSVEAASLLGEVDGTVSAGIVPGRLVFRTTDTSGVVNEAGRFNAAGQLLLNTTSGVNNAPLQIAGAVNYGADSRAVNLAPSFGNSVTGSASVVRSSVSQSAGGTISSLRHFAAIEGTISGTVTNHYGLLVGGLSTGTNVYGVYSSVDTATDRWNFYAQGTAPNYFVGSVRTALTFTKVAVTANSNVTATATVTSLIQGLRTGTPAGAIDLQLPTGTDLEAAFQNLNLNHAFEWSVINLAAGGGGNTITVTANTASTVVGNMVVDGGTSGRFQTRKTGSNTFVTYRIA